MNPHPIFIQRIKSVYTWLWKWITESTARTFTGLVILSLIIGVGSKLTHAAPISYDVTDETQMFLDASINTTQTTGLILSAPQINGTSFTFATTTGGILRIRSGNYREDIYYSSATVATTKKVTLVGVIRNICPQYTDLIVTCGAGRNWGKGAIVELTVDARILNRKADTDRANTYTAAQTFNSGAIFGGTTFALQVSQVTTAQRDAIASPQNGMIVYNNSTGVLNQYIGGVWSDFSTGTTANATETISGKAEAATIKDQSGSVTTGDSGAPLFVQTKYLTSTGGSVTQYGRIPTISKNGSFTGSLIGTGNKNLIGGHTHVSGTGAWVPDFAGVYEKIVYMSGGTLTAVVPSGTTHISLTGAFLNIPASDFNQNVGYSTFISGNIANATSTSFTTKLGTTGFGDLDLSSQGGDFTYNVSCQGTAAAGSSVNVRCTLDGHAAGNTSTQNTHPIVSEHAVATNGILKLNFFVNTTGNQTITINQMYIKKFSTVLFQ